MAWNDGSAELGDQKQDVYNGGGQHLGYNQPYDALGRGTSNEHGEDSSDDVYRSGCVMADTTCGGYDVADHKSDKHYPDQNQCRTGDEDLPQRQKSAHSCPSYSGKTDGGDDMNRARSYPSYPSYSGQGRNPTGHAEGRWSGKAWIGGRGTGGNVQVESYDGGLVRAAVASSGSLGALGWGCPSHLNGPIEFDPSLTRFDQSKKYPISMAPYQSKTTPTYSRADDNEFWDEEGEDDESSDGGMMMEEESVEHDNNATQGSIAPVPSHYRRDSTYRSIVPGTQTVGAIEQALGTLGKGENKNARSVNFTKVSCSQFEGQFCERAKVCEFMVNTYEGGGVTGAREQIWVEFKHMSSGFNSNQAFATFFGVVVKCLTEWKIIDGLVDPTFQPFAGLQVATAEEHSSPAPQEGELKGIIQDRVRELKQSDFLGKQRALSEEILFIAEEHAALVAESPELATVLANLLRKNARSDIQMSRTVNRLMRALVPYRRFEQGLKEATDSYGKPADIIKALIQTSDATKNVAWAKDLFSTVVELQRIGLKCKGKKANLAYARIKARVDAVNLQ